MQTVIDIDGHCAEGNGWEMATEHNVEYYRLLINLKGGTDREVLLL